MAYRLQITTAQGAQVLPLEGIGNGNIPADPSTSYTLIDEQGNPVMEDLSLMRKGDNLVLEVEGESVANIEEFYSVDGSQYVVDGSQALIDGRAASAESTVISSSGLDASGNMIAEGVVWQAETSFLGLSTLQLVGAGLGSAVVVGAAASGSDSGSSSSAAPTPDTTAPTITSGTTATAIDENSGANQVVYTVTAIDDNAVTYSLSGDDASLFTIDSSTGEVTLIADPDYETQSNYSFNVVATDEAGNESEQAVSLDINDTTAPTNTFTNASYDEASNTLTLTGTDMTTLLSDAEDATTDIKGNFNWDNVTWDINTDNDDSNNVSFNLSDIDSVSVQDDNTLTITLTDTSASSLEGSTDFDALTSNDSITIIEGFSSDTAGNVSTTDGMERDTSIVVFDLVNGESSSHSDRSFDADVSYTIYISVDSDSANLSFDDTNEWAGGDNLGRDDTIILVGDDCNIIGVKGGEVNSIYYSYTGLRLTYRSSFSFYAFELRLSGRVLRGYSSSISTENIWSGGATTLAIGITLSNHYLTTMPAGILTSQGLV